jgi:hypothetical protein
MVDAWEVLQIPVAGSFIIILQQEMIRIESGMLRRRNYRFQLRGEFRNEGD